MILIVGATGMLGGMIAHHLIGQGQNVRVLLRHNSPAAELAKHYLATNPQSLIEAGAQPVYGDLKDRPSLETACVGIETLITTANAALRGGEDNFLTVDLQGTTQLVEAARTAGVRHFIYVSAAGAVPGHPHPLYDAKGQIEAILRASGMDFTILSPGVFMEVWMGTVIGIPLRAGQPVTLVGEGARKVAFVSMVDVAAYGVAAVTHPAARNRQIFIGGPTSYTWTETVQAVGGAIGNNLTIHYVSPGTAIPLIPETMGPMLAGMEMADNHIEMAETAKTFGIPPTSLDTFASNFFGASQG